MSKLSTLIYKPNAKSRFILAGAASAVALRKGLWRDKQGFASEAYFSTSRTETRGERRAGQKGPFMDGHQLAVVYSLCQFSFIF